MFVASSIAVSEQAYASLPGMPPEMRSQVEGRLRRMHELLGPVDPNAVLAQALAPAASPQAPRRVARVGARFR
ncbi:MAG TPA: hypothetical protein VKU41_11960 [Polyangiaceae bacterium]|nr:hypothetical protein [Polyangiaceae bacterium]